jgi:hypothetical protein
MVLRQGVRSWDKGNFEPAMRQYLSGLGRKILGTPLHEEGWGSFKV